MGKKRAVHGISAWLVIWQRFGSHVKKPREIAAILNPRLGHNKVKDIIELLYVNEVFSLSEKIGYAMNKRFNPYPAEFGSTKGIRWTGRITCGHNPFLEATLVRDLKVTIMDNKEHLSWIEKEPKANNPLLNRAY